MGEYSTYGQEDEAAWEWLSDQPAYDDNEAVSWEWTDEQADAAGAAGWPPASGDDSDVGQAVSAVINMIPSLVRAIANEEVTTPEQADRWLQRQYPDAELSEVWGAIIGAIASAIPAIIPVVRNIVSSARGRSTSRPRPSTSRQPRRPSPPAGTRRVCQCRNVPIRPGESTTETEYYDDDAELAGAAALVTQLAPMLVQVLPALIPLFTEILRTGVPAVSQAIQGLSGPHPGQRRESWGEDETFSTDTESEQEFEGEPIYLP